MHSSFRVMAKGINLEANGDNQETKIVFKDNDFIDFPIFCREENPPHHQYAPYYYEDGEYYYLKDEPYIEVYFENLPQYDFSEMTVTVNDTEKDIVLEPDQTNQKYFAYIGGKRSRLPIRKRLLANKNRGRL